MSRADQILEARPNQEIRDLENQAKSAIQRIHLQLPSDDDMWDSPKITKKFQADAKKKYTAILKLAAELEKLNDTSFYP